MSTPPAAPAVPGLALAFTHARFLLLENLRVPVAVVSSAVFPTLLLLVFVVPFSDPADPAGVTTAVAQLTVFSVLSTFLFTFGVGVADDREKAWDPYLRTLPAPAWPRIVGRVLAGFASAVLAVLPVAVVGAVATAATATPLRLAAGLLALLAAGLPFLLGGLAIGYSLPVKAAVPVTQLVFFPMALGGGLLLTPEAFPGWLQTASALLPPAARATWSWPPSSGHRWTGSRSPRSPCGPPPPLPSSSGRTAGTRAAASAERAPDRRCPLLPSGACHSPSQNASSSSPSRTSPRSPSPPGPSAGP